MFTVKAFRVDRNEFLHVASARIQPPECCGPNGVAWTTQFMTHSNTSEPLEICGQVFEASTTCVLTCAMFDASGPGVELRVGYFSDSPLRSQMMPDIESARVLAQRWLDTARPAAKGG